MSVAADAAAAGGDYVPACYLVGSSSSSLVV